MPVREDYPFVGRSGYRVSGPLEGGMRSKLSREHPPNPPTAKPLDLPRDVRAELARRRPGFGP